MQKNYSLSHCEQRSCVVTHIENGKIHKSHFDRTSTYAA